MLFLIVSFIACFVISLTRAQSQWLDWKTITQDWQIGYLNFTIDDLGQYRSALQGNGSLEFAVARRNHANDIAYCTWRGWEAPTPPSGWKRCGAKSTDLYFHFNEISFQDVELQFEIMEASGENLNKSNVATMKTAALTLSSDSQDVEHRLLCRTDWDKKHLGCVMNGPVFPEVVHAVQPNVTARTMQPIVVNSLSATSAPACGVTVEVVDPNEAAFLVSGSSKAQVCKASWTCHSNSTVFSHDLDCGGQARGFAVSATLFSDSVDFSKVDVHTVHTFQATKTLTSIYNQAPGRDNGAAWLNAIVNSTASMALTGEENDGPNANSTTVRFEPCVNDCN